MTSSIGETQEQKLEAITEEGIANRDYGESLSKRALRHLLARKSAVVCFLIIFFYLLIAIVGYLGFLPDFQERIGVPHESPAFEFAKVFGTDLFGRSVLYKVLAGAQTAVTMGMLVTAIAVPIGVLLGCLAGFYGGRVDAFIVWLYSVVVSVPYILLIVAVSFALGKGLMAVCVAIGVFNWVGLCRMIRGEVMKHKNREYVLAARLVGANDMVILFRHILPNVIHLAIITASLMVLGAIKSEVILTYIGVGIQNGASWGTMISAAPGELVNGIWWPLAAVVLAMFFLVYALNIAGDALRDALDPKLL
ncbi:MAG: ABC transporter permease [Bdellovibrionota bacterium]